MLTAVQNEVINHLIVIFPNHSRDVIKKTVHHLVNLKETLDKELLLQRGIDLLLDRNVAEQFDDKVISSLDPGDVIITRTDPGEAHITQTEGPKDVISDDTSKISRSKCAPSCAEGNIFKKFDQYFCVNMPGVKPENVALNIVSNKNVENTQVDDIKGTTNDRATKLNLSGSSHRVPSHSSTPVSTGIEASDSTTSSIQFRSQSPWTDDDLTHVLPTINWPTDDDLNIVSDLNQVNKSTGINHQETLSFHRDDNDGLPEILPPKFHKTAISGININNNSLSVAVEKNSGIKDNQIDVEHTDPEVFRTNSSSNTVANKPPAHINLVPTVGSTNEASIQMNNHSSSVVTSVQVMKPIPVIVSSGLARKNTSTTARKTAMPYKVDLTRRALAQRGITDSLPYVKMTVSDTRASDLPGTSLFTSPEKPLSFTKTNTFRSVNFNTLQPGRQFTSDPGSANKVTLQDSNWSSSHGMFPVNLTNNQTSFPLKAPYKASPSATVTSQSLPSHIRVTMYETPSKVTENIDIQKRLGNEPQYKHASQRPHPVAAQAKPEPFPWQQTYSHDKEVHGLPVPVSTPAAQSQGPVVSKATTVTIQSQHVITYTDIIEEPAVAKPSEPAFMIPSEPTVVQSSPEVPVQTTNDLDIGLTGPVQPAGKAEEVEEPDVIITLEKSAEAQRQEVINEVLNLFPDVEHEFLSNLALQHVGQYAVNNICDVLLESHYPKTMTAKEPSATATAPEPSTVTTVDYYTDYTSVKLSSVEDERRYDSQVVAKLTQDFRWISMGTIRKVLGYFQQRYAPSYKALRDLWLQFVKATPRGTQRSYSGKEVRGKIDVGGATVVLKFNLLKNLRLAASPGPNIHPLLQKELTFIARRDEEMSKEADYKMAMELNEQMYEEMGQMIECGCCYGEYPFEGMIQCYDGHLFCQSCLHQYAKESVFGQGKVDLTCMTDDCTSTFPKSQLIRALPSTILDKYEDRLQEESLNLADLGDLVRCPHCDFAAIMDPGDKVFKCQVTSCMRETCRYCKEDWEEHFGKKCEEIEKKDETKLRLEYEEKMTKAKVRTCHKCKAEFTKEDGCNKMTCRCGAKMCYICRKPDISYNHFCNHPRDPGKQCTTCTACSLWTNADEDDNRAVAEIQKAADEARKEKGFIEDKLIGAPSEPPAKKQKKK